MQPLILIPCKSFASGKTRLAPVLAPEAREALCRRFLADTVNLARQLVESRNIHVVSADREVADAASQLGVRSHGDDDRDLNSALTAAAASVAPEPAGEQNLLILPIDLALNTATAMAPVMAARADIVVVPDRREQGTNIMRLPAGIATKFHFQFGHDSFSKHRREADRLGLTIEMVRDPALGFDVDTSADYAAWTARMPGER
jgi:2-phospho-L-lactate guanylyltransferase